MFDLKRPYLVINNTDTARDLLTTFIGGLISIMVFSFSLVMILLNQASSNFSPCLPSRLIYNRRHQMILGIYNSTLLYCIFTLVAITPHCKYQPPGFSVLLAIIFMTVCLAAFICFIHSISHQLQVGTIDKANQGDYTLVEELFQLLKQSYDEQCEHQKWFAKRSEWARHKWAAPCCRVVHDGNWIISYSLKCI